MKFTSFPPKQKEFEPYFSAKTLQRAHESVLEDIRILEASSTQLTAQVQGSELRPYMVMVASSGAYSCTCPSDVQPCKHVAATLLFATKNPPEDSFDLTTTLVNLEAVQAKTLLLELANLPELRPILIKRLMLKSTGVVLGAVKALKKILKRCENIEHETETGEAAFAELATLAPDQRSDEAWQLYELLEDYEPNYQYYDPYDESGDAYWEDRQSEWQGQVLLHWAEAESALGRGITALETLLKKLENTQDLWQATLRAAVLNEGGEARLEKYLSTANTERIYHFELFEREFLQAFGTPEKIEKHLRDNLEDSSNYLRLVEFLEQQNRMPEALDIAADGVRAEIKNENRHYYYYSDYGSPPAFLEPVLQLLQRLQQHQPRFEWDSIALRFKPSLAGYRALQTQPEFASSRAKILKALPLQVLIECLLSDQDLPALKKVLAKNPTTEVAYQLKHVFKSECSEIFRKATLTTIERGSREYYKEAAKYADAYQQLEEAEVFKTWITQLLLDNARRPAMQDEFKSFKQKLK
jgi:hypothetical protein